MINLCQFFFEHSILESFVPLRHGLLVQAKNQKVGNFFRKHLSISGNPKYNRERINTNIEGDQKIHSDSECDKKIHIQNPCKRNLQKPTLVKRDL